MVKQEDALATVGNQSPAEEFSIMELEDRLELADRCNNNCSCPSSEISGGGGFNTAG